MFSAGDLKVCLSSFEFSFYYQNDVHNCCPNCGHYFSTSTEPPSEVRLSSILILIGVGSYVCYKMLKRRKRKEVVNNITTTSSTLALTTAIKNQKSRKLGGIQSFMDDLCCDSQTTNKRHSHYYDESYRRRIGGQYSLDDVQEDDCTPSEKSDCYIFDSFEDCPLILDAQSSTIDHDVDLFEGLGFYPQHVSSSSRLTNVESQEISQLTRSFSLTSQSSLFGNSTISKLDQLLYQIEDIKKSVSEMDTELVGVGSEQRQLNLQYLHLMGSLSGSIDESNEEQSPDGSTGLEPCSPSLEWDSNDVIFSHSTTVNEDNGSDLHTSGQLYADKPLTPQKLLKLESNTSLMSTFKTPLQTSSSESSMYTSYTSSTLDKPDSLLSSPTTTDQEYLKHRALLELIEEAKRLGLFNELQQLFSKHSKRDSAFCED